MTDVTGKSGIGKRVLDDHGNWRAVTSLPKEVQVEIKASQKVAADQFKEKALRHNKDYQDNKSKESESKLKSENDELKAMIKEQGDMLAKLNAKMELGASPVHIGVDVASGPDKSVVTEVPKKLTPKQKLQEEAGNLGIEFEELHTKAELEEMISDHHADMVSNSGEDEATDPVADL